MLALAYVFTLFLSLSLSRLLQCQFFIRANKVEVKPRGEEKEKGGGAGAERKGGKQGESSRKREGKATDSPRAKKQVDNLISTLICELSS